jgi:GNAT superfamily N-acetyltransferase
MIADLSITTVRGGPDFESVAMLCMEFLQWNQVRYAHIEWLVERYYDTSNWTAYVARLPVLCAPPSGEILLARLGSEPAGCVMMRSSDAATCEMKHLFVPERARGHGIGFQLCATLMKLAAERGFREMRLETGSHNDEADILYRRLGFVPSAPWGDYPDDVRPLLRFMRVDLAAESPRDGQRPFTAADRGPTRSA